MSSRSRTFRAPLRSTRALLAPVVALVVLAAPAAASAGPLKVTSFVRGKSPVPNQYPGPSRAIAGDLNADGKDDLVFGNDREVSVVYGTSPSADVDLRDDLGSRGFRIATGTTGPVVDVDPAGDFDRDGVDDLLVGTDGNAFVVYGAAGTTGTLPLSAGPRITQITRAGGAVEQDLAGIGDFNGDGYDDVAVQRGSAGASIVLGGPRVATISAGAVASRVSLLPSTTRCGWVFFTYKCVPLGVNFEPLGDFDGDGKDDLAFENSNRDGNFVLYGRTGTFSASPAPQAGVTRLPVGVVGQVASTVGNITRTGDVNSDGYDDAMSWGNVLILGRAGRPASIAASSPLITLTAATGASFTVEPIGDQNGDGRDDLAVHRYLAPGTPGSPIRIVTAIPLSAPGTVNVDAGAPVEGVPAGADASIEGLGDLDGDGLGDLVVGTSGSAESAYVATHGSGTPVETPRAAVLNSLIRVYDASNAVINDIRPSFVATCNGQTGAPVSAQPGYEQVLGEYEEGDACFVTPSVAFNPPLPDPRCVWQDRYFVNWTEPIEAATTFRLVAGQNHLLIERRCELPSDEPPTSFESPGWVYSGSAVQHSYVLQITDPQANQTGSAMWPKPVDYRNKTIEFTARLAGGNGAAEGMTVAFVRPDASGQPSGGRIGAGGAQLGFGGLGGVAMAIDVKRDAGDPSANFLGFTDGPSGTGGLRWTKTAVASTAYRTSAGRKFKIVNKNGSTTVYVDGGGKLTAPFAIPPSSFLAFTGSTGSVYQDQSFSFLKITNS